jgi:hypothetical protein
MHNFKYNVDNFMGKKISCLLHLRMHHIILAKYVIISCYQGNIFDNIKPNYHQNEHFEQISCFAMCLY